MASITPFLRHWLAIVLIQALASGKWILYSWANGGVSAVCVELQDGRVVYMARPGLNEVIDRPIVDPVQSPCQLDFQL